jgi:hypothetical protein
MIVHHGEPPNGDRENIRKSFQPALDPFFSVGFAFAEQKRSAHTSRHAVVPAGYGRIDEMRASHRHSGISSDVRPTIPNPFEVVNIASPVLAFRLYLNNEWTWSGLAGLPLIVDFGNVDRFAAFMQVGSGLFQ